MAVIIVIFFLNDNKLSSHVSQISEHINSSNQKNHSYDQMVKVIVNLGINKDKKNSSPQHTRLHHSLLNCWLTASITYHDFLHRFRAGRGTGTATLEAKLLQQLAALREEVLYVIFGDLHKACGALDGSRCLEILEGYGVGPQACWILWTYWLRFSMVARTGGGYYRKLLRELGA